MNQLVLRSTLSGEATFRELRAQIRKMTVEAYAHQDLPFGKLVEELRPKRNLSYSPLCQVKFVLQNTPQISFDLANIAVRAIKTNYDTSKFDLTFLMQENGDRIQGIIEYNIHLFKTTTIEQISGHFQTLLEGIVAYPEQKIAFLPLLSKGERQQLLVNSNEITFIEERRLCIHQWFEEQVENTPDAVVGIFHTMYLTYRELNERANQLAHYLQAQEVRAEVCVGIYLERSLDLLISILGILKAGGTYVPLDPSYPQERIRFMLSDAHIPLLITQRELDAEQLDYQGVIVCLDSSWLPISQFPKTKLANCVTPENTAYVIYTSGSTGKPKGVLVTHHNLVYSTRSRVAFYQNPVDRLLVLPSFAFDSSVAGIFWVLCAGGTLILPHQNQAQDIPQITNLLILHGVSHWISSPSLYYAFLRQKFSEEDLPLIRLHNAIVAGELCTG